MQSYFSDPPRWLFALWGGVTGGAGVGLFVKVVTEASWAVDAQAMALVTSRAWHRALERGRTP